MSRRHLTLAVVALASFVVAACSSSPTAPASPEQGIRTPGAATADSVMTIDPVTGRSIWASSNG